MKLQIQVETTNKLNNYYFQMEIQHRIKCQSVSNFWYPWCHLALPPLTLRHSLSLYTHVTDKDVVMCSPRPYPFPRFHPRHRPLRVLASAMRTGRGKGEFGIGSWLPLPPPPFPWRLFSSGRHQRKGGPTMPWSSPPPPPPLHMLAPGAARQSWVERRRRGRGQNLKTPNSTSTPPPVLLAGLHHKKVGGECGEQRRWGKGFGPFGEFSRSLPQLYPPPPKVCPPRMWGRMVSTALGRRGVAFG